MCDVDYSCCVIIDKQLYLTSQVVNPVIMLEFGTVLRFVHDIPVKQVASNVSGCTSSFILLQTTCICFFVAFSLLSSRAI